MATTTLPSGVGPLATCRQSCHVDSPSCRTASSSVVGRTALRSALGGRALGGSSTAGLRSWRGKSGSGSGGAERLRVRALTEEEVDVEGESIADDYYSILGLTCDATPEEIKRAYYACMKACHPDLSNNHPDSVTFCSFVNEVYEVLSDPEMRLVYDEIKGYSLTSINPFMDTRHEKDQVFVDEFTCIGCKNCANTAEDTFEIEEMWGRARVCNQGGNPPAKIQEAVETCQRFIFIRTHSRSALLARNPPFPPPSSPPSTNPLPASLPPCPTPHPIGPVSCIHWVKSPQLVLLEDEMGCMERVSVAVMHAHLSSLLFSPLPLFFPARVPPHPISPVSCIHWVTSPQLALLEDEMRRMERVSVAIMQAQSSRGADVFMQANSRWEKRRNKALSKAKAQAARDGKAGKYNKPLWETMGEAMGMGGEKSSWRGDGEGVSDKAASSNPVNQEKVRRAAAAARRWREYSRQGVDRRRKMFLAAESGGSDESAGEEIEEERKEEGGEKVQGKGKGKQAEERDREPVAL
ncbi:unnamed protein product [Closterium sp. NIES-64]|nr:unnamed protein product [Closterium sp. NIES-64]